MRLVAVLCAAVLTIAAAGCGADDPTQGPSGAAPGTSAAAKPTGTTHPPDSDVIYSLPKSMCASADLTAMTDLYPKLEEKPLVSSSRTCGTAVLSPTEVVSVEVRADLMPDPRRGRLLFQTARDQARNTPHDIPGAGSAAFWEGNEQQTKLTTYHGNLVLTITCATIRTKQLLPPDVAERMVRIAAATLAKLKP